MALVDLTIHSVERPVKLLAIAQRQGLDQGYLEQIFAKLKKSNLIVSSKGPGGGYMLNRKPNDISISDIMFAVEENISMTRCKKDSPEGCMLDKSRCRTHHLWEDLGEHIYKFLRNISLDDVCSKKFRS